MLTSWLSRRQKAKENADTKRTVGDPSLGAVEHPLVPLKRGRTRRGSGVATVSGFTQGEATDVLPIEKRLLKDLLLLRGGILIDGTQVERVIDAHDLEKWMKSDEGKNAASQFGSRS